jgi:hypothetical protein
MTLINLHTFNSVQTLCVHSVYHKWLVLTKQAKVTTILNCTVSISTGT